MAFANFVHDWYQLFRFNDQLCQESALANVVLILMRRNLPIPVRYKCVFDKTTQGSRAEHDQDSLREFTANLVDVQWGNDNEQKYQKLTGYFEFILEYTHNDKSLSISNKRKKTKTGGSALATSTTEHSPRVPGTKELLTQKRLASMWKLMSATLASARPRPKTAYSAWKDIEIRCFSRSSSSSSSGPASESWYSLTDILPLEVRKLQVSQVFKWILSRYSWPGVSMLPAGGPSSNNNKTDLNLQVLDQVKQKPGPPRRNLPQAAPMSQISQPSQAGSILHASQSAQIAPLPHSAAPISSTAVHATAPIQLPMPMSYSTWSPITATVIDNTSPPVTNTFEMNSLVIPDISHFDHTTLDELLGVGLSTGFTPLSPVFGQADTIATTQQNNHNLAEPMAIEHFYDNLPGSG